LEAQEKERLATEEAAKKAAAEAAEAAKNAQLHVITEEDLKANPKLGEKFKVGDKVDPTKL